MLPIRQYTVNDGTIYFAVAAEYAERLDDLYAKLPPSLFELSAFRLMLIGFSDRLELLHLCDESTIDGLRHLLPRSWRKGNDFDAVLGLVTSDRATLQERDRATLFVLSDGDVKTHWNIGTLSQVVNVIWLHEANGQTVVTPFGCRHEIDLRP